MLWRFTVLKRRYIGIFFISWYPQLCPKHPDEGLITSMSRGSSSGPVSKVTTGGSRAVSTNVLAHGNSNYHRWECIKRQPGRKQLKLVKRSWLMDFESAKYQILFFYILLRGIGINSSSHVAYKWRHLWHCRHLVGPCMFPLGFCLFISPFYLRSLKRLE